MKTRLLSIIKAYLPLILLCILTFSVIALYRFSFVTSRCPNVLGVESAKFIVESNNSFLTFYAVLFLTCLVGIIELLPQFDNSSHNVYTRHLMTTLYVFFVVGVFLSLSKFWEMYRGISEIVHSGKLGLDIEQYVGEGLFEHFYLLNPWAEAIVQSIIVIVLELLLFSKIGWLPRRVQ